MKKVLIINDHLEHYRVPLFNALAEDIELTIATTSHSLDCNNVFKIVEISLQTKFGFIFYSGLPEFSMYDVVVLPFNVRNLFLFFQEIFKKRNYRIFLFGIGVSASYNRKYDEFSLLSSIRSLMVNKADGVILYEKYPEIKYISKNENNSNKISVAFNTVAPNKNFDIKNKTFESFLFIGSLYKQKRIYELLEGYYMYYLKCSSRRTLEIVGDGEEYENIKQWIIKRGLVDFVILHGKITDDDSLLPIMSRSIACISPGQAGLSVQKCFSYGIPFITTKEAITGGESHSIIDNITGSFYIKESISDLSSKLMFYGEDIDFCKKTSTNAYLFYSRFRNISIWKEGFLKNI